MISKERRRKKKGKYSIFKKCYCLFNFVVFFLIIIITDEEDATYDTLDFSLDDLHAAVGNKTNIHPDAKLTLQHRWRYPSLSIHGVEGAFHQPGDKTVISSKVIIMKIIKWI